MSIIDVFKNYQCPKQNKLIFTVKNIDFKDISMRVYINVLFRDSMQGIKYNILKFVEPETKNDD